MIHEAFLTFGALAGPGEKNHRRKRPERKGKEYQVVGRERVERGMI
jgi:hypothetical protein